MRHSPRLCMSIAALALSFPLALSLPGKPAYAADNQVTFIFGGDVEWSLKCAPADRALSHLRSHPIRSDRLRQT